jgi:branched-chain amino acid transport system substrate-binding protein
MRYLNGLRRTRVGAAVLLFATACVAAAVCASAARSSDQAQRDSTKTLKYGLLVPLSGPAAAFGPPERASVETAVDRINSRGGIKVGGDTYKLELHVYDTAFDPTKAVSKTREAISRDGIRFLGVDGGVVTSAIQPITDSSKVLISALAAGDKFFGKAHPLAFRDYYSIPDALHAGLTVLKPTLGKHPKLVDLYPDDDLARAFAPQSRAAAKKLGYSASSVFVGRDVTDFNSVLTKVLAMKPDVIDFGVMPPSQYAVVVQQARQLGYKGKFIFDDTIYIDAVTKAAGKGAVTGSVSVPYLADFKTAEGKYWAANVGKHDGGDASQGWTALVYDNLLLLAKAVEKAQSTDPVKVADAMGKVTVNGVLGKVGFGGQKHFGLPRVFNINYSVAVITAAGKLKKVATVNPA